MFIDPAFYFSCFFFRIPKPSCHTISVYLYVVSRQSDVNILLLTVPPSPSPPSVRKDRDIIYLRGPLLSPNCGHTGLPHAWLPVRLARPAVAYQADPHSPLTLCHTVHRRRTWACTAPTCRTTGTRWRRCGCARRRAATLPTSRAASAALAAGPDAVTGGAAAQAGGARPAERPRPAREFNSIQFNSSVFI